MITVSQLATRNLQDTQSQWNTVKKELDDFISENVVQEEKAKNKNPVVKPIEEGLTEKNLQVENNKRYLRE